MAKRLALLLSTLLLVFVASIGLDRLAARFLTPHQQGLIFPRSVSVRMDTPEFSSSIKTNSMGFRDREFTTQKVAGTRIVAIGDSFTFGWGVQAEESWPRMLENRLRSSGLDVEVANLGKPGGSVTNYADIATQCFPALHPDLLIVAVLQGDDLAEMGFPTPGDFSLGQERRKTDMNISDSAPRRFAKRLYPNVVLMIDQTDGRWAQLAREWKSLAQDSLAAFTPAERSRFDQLDDNVKKAFLAGEVNPTLVYLGVHTSDYFMETMTPDSPIAKTHIAMMADQLKRIKSAALKNNVTAIVVSVPYGIYVSKDSFETRKRIGFNTVPEMLTASEPDQAIRQASELAGLEFYEVTNDVRNAAIDHKLFFELDGHFNRAGHAAFAEALAPIIRNRLETSQK